MTPLPLLDADGVTVGRAALAEAIAGQPIKQHLIHETVVAELAARRAGSASTLTRGKVRGGGAKPWRQKGTGRARQGSIRSPQWTGGGIVFGPTPRSYGGKVNRKVRAQAFRAALRAQAERGTAALMDPTGWDAPSTKRAAEYLRQASDALGGRPLLIVLEDADSVEGRSFRNLAGVLVLAAVELETVDVVAARAILVGPAEVEAVEPKRKPKPRKKATPKATPKTVAPPPEPEAEAAAEAEPEAAEPEAAAPEAAEAAIVEEPAPAEPEAPVEEPVAEEEPAAEEPAEPVAEEPVEEEKPAPKPRAKKPPAKKPAAKKPAAKKAPAKEPAAEEPAAEADGEEAS